MGVCNSGLNCPDHEGVMDNPYKKVSNRGEVNITKKSNGHFQICGLVLVNHYPSSKNRTAYIKGTTKGINNVSPEQAVNLALNPDCMKVPEKAKRKTNYKNIKDRLFRKNKKCHWCNKAMTREEVTLEHIVPLSKGGLDAANNWALAHEKCNQNHGNNWV